MYICGIPCCKTIKMHWSFYVIWMISMKRFQSHLYEIFSPHVRRIEPIFHRKDIKLNQVMHWFIRVSNSWTSEATKEWICILSLCKGSRRNIWLCVMIGDAKTFARGAKILTLSAKNPSSLLMLWTFSIELDKQQGGVGNDQGERICWTTCWTSSQAKGTATKRWPN